MKIVGICREIRHIGIAAPIVLLLMILAIASGASALELNATGFANATDVSNDTEITRQVIESWFDAAISMNQTEIDEAFGSLDENAEWINIQPVKGVSDVLPWIGTFHGPEGVIKSISTYGSLVNVTDFRLIKLFVEGDQAVALVHEAGVFKSNGHAFSSDIAAWFKVDTSRRKIVHWKGFWDPSPVIAAIEGGAEQNYTRFAITPSPGSDSPNSTNITRQIAEIWFNSAMSMNQTEIDKAFGLLDENVEWANVQPMEGVSDVLPWIGTFHGPEGVIKSISTYGSLVNVTDFGLIKLFVEGDQAVALVHEAGVFKSNGRAFDAYIVTWFQINTSRGKIVRWKGFWDPSKVIAAITSPKVMNETAEEWNTTEITRQVAEAWYSAGERMDPSGFSLIDEDVEWTNIQLNPYRTSYAEGDNDTLPWIGTMQGMENVTSNAARWMSITNVTNYTLLELFVNGDQAIGLVHEEGVVTATGRTYQVDLVTFLQVDTSDGKIISWKSFWQAPPVLSAMQPQSQIEDGVGKAD